MPSGFSWHDVGTDHTEAHEGTEGFSFTLQL